MKKCSVDGCVKFCFARGWCDVHYKRWQKYKDVNFVKRKLNLLCMVENCGKPHQAKGYCKRHYERLRINGSPYILKKNPWSSFDTAFEEFESHLIKKNGSDCWGWYGTKDRQGYGYFSFGNKRYKNSRFSYEYYIGEIPDGMFCCHHCDNPECSRPDHLFIGTPKDNTQDCKIKGRLNTTPRRNPVIGEAHGMSKLNNKKIKTIKKLFSDGMDSIQIALIFNVHASTIRRIRLNQTWKHVEI